MSIHPLVTIRIIAVAFLIGCCTAHSQQYTITDIGTFGGVRADNNASSIATAVNNVGAVVGESFVTNGGYHAFLYTNGVLFDIGTMGQKSCHAASVNDAGEVTGFIGNSLLGDEGSIMRAFVYRGGVMTDLASLIPGSQKSWGSDINNSGQVVGWYISSTGYQRPFLHSNGTVQDLGYDGSASSINSSGLIVGSTRVGSEFRVVITSNGVNQVLSSLGNASVGHVNDSGHIVGNHGLSSAYHAYLYSRGQVIDLGTFGGNTSQAFCINNHDQVVGQADTASGAVHAYVYRDGMMLDLNKLIPTNSGWVLDVAYGINDNGLIVGTGTKNGQGRAFLLTPNSGYPPATNKVLSLDGNGDYVTIPSAPDLQNSNEISIEAWICPQQGNQNNTMYINKSDNATASSSRSYELQWVANADSGGPGNSIRFIVFLSNGNWAYVNAPAAENKWVHIAAIFSSSQGLMQLFTNGILAAISTTDAGGLSPLTGTLLRQTTLPVRFGRGDYDPYFYAQGLLDEVRIWNKSLTPAEIYASRFCKLSGAEPNLVAYWTFDDGTASDQTGRGHNGSFAGNAQAIPIQGADAVHAGVCGDVYPSRPSTATANVTYGFVVDASITDGGYGYTNTPSVRIFDATGSGAQAVAVVSNGVVTAIQILNAGYGYTDQPVIVIAPPFIEKPLMGVESLSLLNFTNLLVGTNYQLQVLTGGTWSNLGMAFTATNTTYMQYVSGTASAGQYRLGVVPVPPQAYATAQVVNGFVVGATVTIGGSGYGTPPSVTISGGGGTNATAIAVISAGVVTRVNITSAGIGYTNTPSITIAPPPAQAVSPIVTQVMKLNMGRFAPYDKYQLEFCPVLGGAWINMATPFIPTAATNTQLINVTGRVGFFRAKHLP